MCQPPSSRPVFDVKYQWMLDVLKKEFPTAADEMLRRFLMGKDYDLVRFWNKGAGLDVTHALTLVTWGASCWRWAADRDQGRAALNQVARRVRDGQAGLYAHPRAPPVSIRVPRVPIEPHPFLTDPRTAL